MDDQRKTRMYQTPQIALVLVVCLAGCSDFSQHRFGGIRREAPKLASPVHPVPSLAIGNPPTSTKSPTSNGIQPAGFVQETPANFPRTPNAPIGSQSLRILLARAAQTYAGMDSYNFRFTRRESVGGKPQPEELILVKVRRKPFSVNLKWLGNEGKGREVIYVDGKFGNKLQILTAPGEVFPFAPPTRFNFSPDDRMVKSKTRRPITETGFGNLIDIFARVVSGAVAGDMRLGTVKYLGPLERKEFQRPVEAVHHKIPPGYEAGLPKGGQRWWYFDPTHGLPVLVITHDETGEVEYYRHDLVQWPARLDDLDFDPDRMGKQ